MQGAPIILGTRDYEGFDKSYDFLQKAFNPGFKPPDIVSSLLSADDVIIFGHSLGENDSQYFKPFFLKQANPSGSEEKRITIFTFDDESEIEIKRSLRNLSGGNLSVLYSNNKLEIIKTFNVNSREEIKAFCLRYVGPTLIRAE